MSPAATRWKTFLDKVDARVRELDAEGRAGLAELVETEVLDPTPLSSALSELKARFQNLTKKIDEAWSGTIEPLLADAPEAEWNAQWREGEAARRRIDRASTAIERWALATHARALHAVVEREAAVQPACGSCRAPLPAKVRPRTVNVTCAHCRAVTTVRPGAATAFFFGGGALHALAVEAAAAELDALEDAERRFRAYAHVVDDDTAEYVEALTRGWTAWATAKAQWDPGSTPASIAKDVEVKVGQASADLDREAPRRAARTKALALAEANDVRGLVAFLSGEGKKAYFSADDLAECAAEHDSPGLGAALEALFVIDAPSEPKRAFLAEKRAEVLQTIRRRRR